MTVLEAFRSTPGQVRPELLAGLASCWACHGSGAARWAGYEGYVQWAGWPEGVQIESCASPLLTEATREAAALLVDLGFSPPDETTPNWHQRITQWEDLPAAADTLLRCLFDVLNPALIEDLETPPIACVDPGPALGSELSPILTVAPVGKHSPALVATALAQALAFDGPLLVLDAADYSGCLQDLPGFTRTAIADLPDAASPPTPGRDRVLASGLSEHGPVPGLLAAADVVRAALGGQSAGWTVLVVGPPAFSTWHWVYEQALLRLTDGLVIVRDLRDSRDGHYQDDAGFLLKHAGHLWHAPITVAVSERPQEVEVDGLPKDLHATAMLPDGPLPAPWHDQPPPTWLVHWARLFPRPARRR